VIIAIGGLPGVGKTTTARAVAGRLRAAHLRIDAFETALVATGVVGSAADVGPAGYGLALAAADTCLAAGTDVVVDAVFPVAASREPWAELARRHGTTIRWVRLVCGDPAEHRRRVEQRTADLPGHVVPTWTDVLAAAEGQDDWAEPHDVVDTAVSVVGTAGDDAVTAVLRLFS
jgi:predicted kinase